MRQTISNVATRLFVERGFDNVSVADIAHEAEVARKTVFNYFPRKENLFFDREEEGRALVREALAGRGRQSPVGAVETLMRALVEQQHPLVRVTDGAVQFWRTVEQSPALSARACELQVTLADDLAGMLSRSAGRPRSDPAARLAAAMLMATLVVAYEQELRTVRETKRPGAAFLSVMDRGFAGVGAALHATPYV